MSEDFLPVYVQLAYYCDGFDCNKEKKHQEKKVGTIVSARSGKMKRIERMTFFSLFLLPEIWEEKTMKEKRLSRKAR